MDLKSNRLEVGLVGYIYWERERAWLQWKLKEKGAETDRTFTVVCHSVCISPSQPRSTCPMVAKASAKRSGSRPFKSTVARQPWNPSLECTSLGRSLYISLETPPMYRSPVGRTKQLMTATRIQDRNSLRIFFTHTESTFKKQPICCSTHARPAWGTVMLPQKDKRRRHWGIHTHSH